MGKKTITELARLHREGDECVTEVIWSYTEHHPAMGRSYYVVNCPVCNEQMQFYPWSLAGSGKKCENKDCETVFYSGSRGLTFKD